MLVQDCNDCLKANVSNGIANCSGNCQLNKHTKVCERRGRRCKDVYMKI